MPGRLILIDSNILVYAINNSSPKNRTAQSFLQSNIEVLALAHQNILESLRVLTHNKFPHPMPAEEAERAISDVARVCRIITPDRLTYQILLDLLKKYKLAGDKIFDAYLAATAVANGINTIATDNTKDFDIIEEVSTLNPFALAP